jgi:hypothetical protein
MSNLINDLLVDLHELNNMIKLSKKNLSLKTDYKECLVSKMLIYDKLKKHNVITVDDYSRLLTQCAHIDYQLCF